MGIEVAHALSTRGIAMTWNWGDTNPFNVIRGIIRTNSWIKCLEKIADGLSYLISTITTNDPSKTNSLRDTPILSNRSVREKFNLLITDPPYRDDVPYSELSDFYYVWLKRVLSDVDEFGRRVPLFHSDLFFDEFGREIVTQWERFAPLEVSYNEGRMKYFGLCGGASGRSCEGVFREKFRVMVKWLSGMLRGDGVLVFYFAHSRPEAFVDVVDAAIHSGLRVTAGFPLATESAESIVSRGKAAILHSVVLVMRKGREGRLDLAESEEELVADLSGFLERLYGKHVGMTSYVMTFSRALGHLMRYEEVVRGSHVFSPEEMVREAARLTALAFSRRCRSRVHSPEAVLYLLLKQALPRPRKGSRKVSSDSLLLFSYGTLDLRRLVEWGVVRPVGKASGGADVGKRKEYVLLEPLDNKESEFALLAQGVPRSRGAYRPRHSLDVYRILALYSFRPKKVFLQVYYDLSAHYPDLVEDAVELMKALSSLEDDPDGLVSREILTKYLELGEPCGKPRREASLDKYF